MRTTKLRNVLRRIPDQIRKKAFSLWIEGYSYRYIGRKLRISISTISTIIDEERQRTPDLDELRTLNLWIKKNDSDIYEALRGANLRKQLDQIDVNPDTIENFIDLSKKIII
jgi:hypothetical protein